jgi:hypothetical protein
MRSFSVGGACTVQPNAADLAAIIVEELHFAAQLGVADEALDVCRNPLCRRAHLGGGRQIHGSVSNQAIAANQKAVSTALLPIALNPKQPVVTVTGGRGEATVAP